MTVRNEDVGDRPEDDLGIDATFSLLTYVGGYDPFIDDDASTDKALSSSVDTGNREFFLEDIPSDKLVWNARIRGENVDEEVDVEMIWRNETTGEKLFEFNNEVPDPEDEGYASWNWYEVESWIDGKEIDKPGIYSVEIDVSDGASDYNKHYFRVIRKDPLKETIWVQEGGSCVKKEVDASRVPSSAYKDKSSCEADLPEPEDSPEDDGSKNNTMNKILIVDGAQADVNQSNMLVEKFESIPDVDVDVKVVGVNSDPTIPNDVDGVIALGSQNSNPVYRRFVDSGDWDRPDDSFDDVEITGMVKENGVIYQGVAGRTAEDSAEAVNSYVSSGSPVRFVRSMDTGVIENNFVSKIKDSRLAQVSIGGILIGVLIWLTSR